MQLSGELGAPGAQERASLPVRPPGRTARILRLLAAEFRRLRGRPGPVLSLSAVSASTLLAAAGFLFFLPAEDSGQLVNGWRCLAVSASWGLSLGAFMVLLLCAQSISGENQSGSLRTTLTKPALRSDVFAAKALFAFVTALAAHAAAWVPAFAVSLVSAGFGDVVEAIPYSGEIYLHTHRTAADMTHAALAACLLSLPPLAACAALGLACSAVARKPASAISAAAAVYLSLVFGAGVFPERFSRLSFASHVTRFTSVLGDLSSGLNTAALQPADVRFSLVSSGAAAILLLAGSFIFFRARDIVD